MRSGWGEVDYPQVVGHEIVGTAIRVGKNVNDIKVYTPFFIPFLINGPHLAPFLGWGLGRRRCSERLMPRLRSVQTA